MHKEGAMQCDSCGVLRCCAAVWLRTEIELVVNAREDLGDGGRVGDHADGALHLGQISAGDDGGGLVVDTALETSRAPVDELEERQGTKRNSGEKRSTQRRSCEIW